MTFQNLAVFRRAMTTAALVALAGCAAAAAAASNTPAPGTIRSGSSVADGRIARDARLRLADFPSGWTATPRPSIVVHTSCQAVNGAQTAVRALMRSPEFLQSNGLVQAESTAYVYADAATARHYWFAELSSRATRNCLAHALVESVSAAARSQGVIVGPVRTRPLALATIGDQRSASRLIVRVSKDTLALDADADLVIVRIGRGLAVFSFGAVASPFGHRLETRLVQTVAGRLGTDLGRAG